MDSNSDLVHAGALAIQDELAKEDAQRNKLIYMIKMEVNAIETIDKKAFEIINMRKMLEKNNEENKITIKNLIQMKAMVDQNLTMKRQALIDENIKIDALEKELESKQQRKQSLIEQFAVLRSEVELEMQNTRNQLDGVRAALEQVSQVC